MDRPDQFLLLVVVSVGLLVAMGCIHEGATTQSFGAVTFEVSVTDPDGSKSNTLISASGTSSNLFDALAPTIPLAWDGRRPAADVVPWSAKWSAKSGNKFEVWLVVHPNGDAAFQRAGRGKDGMLFIETGFSKPQTASIRDAMPSFRQLFVEMNYVEF